MGKDWARALTRTTYFRVSRDGGGGLGGARGESRAAVKQQLALEEVGRGCTLIKTSCIWVSRKGLALGGKGAHAHKLGKARTLTQQ